MWRAGIGKRCGVYGSNQRECLSWTIPLLSRAMATPHRDSAFTLLTNRHTSRRVELILNLDRSVMNSPTECRVTNDTVPLLDEHRTNAQRLGKSARARKRPLNLSRKVGTFW